MKVLIAILLLAAAVNANPNVFKDQCMSELNLSSSDVGNNYEEGFTHNEKCLGYCILEKIGILTAEGDLNLGAVRTLFEGKIPFAIDFDQIGEDCARPDIADPCERGFAVHQCFNNSFKNAKP